jgi:hypothetical protein
VDQPPETMRGMHDNLVLLAGRLLLAWILVHEAVFLAMNFGNAATGWPNWAFPDPRSLLSSPCN